jgi:hypothetical protein
MPSFRPGADRMTHEVVVLVLRNHRGSSIAAKINKAAKRG